MRKVLKIDFNIKIIVNLSHLIMNIWSNFSCAWGFGVLGFNILFEIVFDFTLVLFDLLLHG